MRATHHSHEAMTDVRNSRQHGSALLMAVFVTALVTAGGISLLFLGTTELKMSHRNVDFKQAFYIAEAGEEAARTSLFLVNGNDDFSDELASLAGDNGTFDLDMNNLSATLDSAGALTGVTGVEGDLPFRITSLRQD